MLTSYRTSSEGVTGPMFRFDNVTEDGLGRLKSGWEQISYQGQNKQHMLQYQYDMRSQLTNALITNIGGSPWIYDYHYRLDGNIDSKVVNVEGTTEYEYDGDIMTDATTGGNPVFSLTWDENGRLTLKDETIDTTLVYNWDGKLRSATCSPNSISLKYDPFGNRVIKNSSINGNRKYIIDISGELPTILMEIRTTDYAVMKTYIYANAEVLAQHDGDYTANRYFYLHDRLGSVREIIDADGAVQNSYTYDAFGKSFDSEYVENVTNPFKFTGQWFDSEIEQYYLRARMYDPVLMRFTARDPVRGGFREPITLHKYLYCMNNPTNNIDPSGRICPLLMVLGGIVGGVTAGITSTRDGFQFNDLGAIFMGIGLGMFAGMLPNTLIGAFGGMILSGMNTAYSTWIGGGDMDKLGMHLFINAVGAGIGGQFSALLKSGAASYLGSEVLGWIYSYIAGGTYELGGKIVENYTDLLKELSSP
jgi:RHS repeat-associated protein